MYRFIHQKRHEGGFTLLELLIVVVIIGILVAVAMPQYLKTKEKARVSEALTMLGQIRASEMRYYAENDKVTTTLTDLDFDPADVAGTLMYTPFTVSLSGSNFVISANRITSPGPGPGCTANYDVGISKAGTLCGRNCQTNANWTTTNCTP